MVNKFIFVFSVMMLSAVVWAADYSHMEYFEHYEGTKTCLECHQEEAETFFQSQHYQWKGETPDLKNAKGKKLGKLNTMNDFCTNPAATWIGRFENSEGKTLSKGCSQCHAGSGLMPSEVMTDEQLNNIDCLVCHANGYRRDVYLEDDGSYKWKSILWKNREGLDIISRRISLPTRTMCLRCHAGSGGGLNWKRGDIEYAMKKADRDFDVHLASGIECTDCHAGKDHRFLGRGVDLAATDSPGKKLSCEGECHNSTPHKSSQLNSHTDRVDCTACHIPSFAKEEETDMERDWSNPVYKKEHDKWEPSIDFGLNVEPVYAWWNGKTSIQELGTPVKNRKGVVSLMTPEGGIKDKHSKIFPFKVHKAKLPVDADSRVMLPIKVATVFQTGNIQKGIDEGSKAFYGKTFENIEWIDTVRYMGIYHEVQPAEKALQCLDCHGKKGRMDFRELGYNKDPLLKALD